ncbi:MAG: hypothetical protein ACO3A2_08040 [Bdellovibrionia bacterium]
MKYFSHYLVSKGVVSEEVLVKCLLRQVQELPILAEVVLSVHLLTPQQVLEVLLTQKKQKIDFQQACAALGFWTEELSQAVERVLAEKRRPIFSYLLNEGVDLAALINALDDFLYQVELSSDATGSPAL